jgi:hypothetical protein
MHKNTEKLTFTSKKIIEFKQKVIKKTPTTLYLPQTNRNLKTGLRIHNILVWFRIRIHGTMPLTNGSGFLDSDPDPGPHANPDPHSNPDPAIFIIDLQEANKKLIFFKKFFCILLFEGTFTSFFKDK